MTGLGRLIAEQFAKVRSCPVVSASNGDLLHAKYPARLDKREAVPVAEGDDVSIDIGERADCSTEFPVLGRVGEARVESRGQDAGRTSGRFGITGHSPYRAAVLADRTVVTQGAT